MLLLIREIYQGVLSTGRVWLGLLSRSVRQTWTTFLVTIFLYLIFLTFKNNFLLPYARHYNPRFIFILPHFSLRFIFKSGLYCREVSNYMNLFSSEVPIEQSTSYLRRKKNLKKVLAGKIAEIFRTANMISLPRQLKTQVSFFLQYIY